MSWDTEEAWSLPTEDELMNDVLKRQEDLGLRRYGKVVVVGVGGIGYWVAKLLALSRSVGRIVLVDPELVEAVNLNRLDLPAWFINAPKVDAVRAMVEANIPLAPAVDAVQDKYDVTYIEGADLVIECVDNVEAGERVVRDAVSAGIPVISVHYNGVDHVTISVNEVHGTWGEGGGYVRTPSFAAPAVIAAALAVFLALTRDLRGVRKTWYVGLNALLAP